MSQVQHRILLVDDEPNLRKVLGALLKQLGFEVHAENDGAAALARVRAAPPGTFDVVITDLRMPNLDGMGLLKALQVHEPGLPVILLTAHGSIDSAVEAVKLGAFDYLEKPFDKDQIHQIVQKAITTRERSGPSIQPSPPPGEIADPCAAAGMVGRSPSMQAIREIVGTVAASPSTVLIAGESGTGKELVARALHLGSARRSQPFIKVNCAAIPGGLVESELFGHERGAFTGALATKQGLFDAAHEGTLFLDEIGDIDLQVQPKILKALEERRYRRLGDVRERATDVRLIAATHHDLLEAVERKVFRADLFYRVSTVTLRVPSLRERPEDIPSLVDHILTQEGAPHVTLTREAWDKLTSYGWPGNIRELRNVVHRALLHREGDVVSASDVRFDTEPRASTRMVAAHVSAPDSASMRTLEEVEREHIARALASEQGRVTDAARKLGIPRSTLYQKLKTYGIALPARTRGPWPPPSSSSDD